MEKWEYDTCLWSPPRPTLIKSEHRAFFNSYLNERGQDCWELVAIPSNLYVQRVELVFKRKVQHEAS